MPNRGSFNRYTGKTTPRKKAKTHWGAKRRARPSASAGAKGKAAAKSGASKGKKP